MNKLIIKMKVRFYKWYGRYKEAKSLNYKVKSTIRYINSSIKWKMEQGEKCFVLKEFTCNYDRRIFTEKEQIEKVDRYYRKKGYNVEIITIYDKDNLIDTFKISW